MPPAGWLVGEQGVSLRLVPAVVGCVAMVGPVTEAELPGAVVDPDYDPEPGGVAHLGPREVDQQVAVALVEHLVQVDIRQNRRYHPALRRSGFWDHQRPVLQHAGVQPFPKESQHDSVAHPLLQDSPKHRVVEAIEKVLA